MTRKGQTISMDLVLACVVFGILIAYIANTLYEGYQDVSEMVLLRDISTRATQVTNLLTATPGVPGNWEDNPDATILVGLSPRTGEISGKKVSALETLDYATLKQKARTGGYEIYVLVSTPDGKKIMEAGARPAGILSVSRNRISSCDGKPCIVRVTLWTR